MEALEKENMRLREELAKSQQVNEWARSVFQDISVGICIVNSDTLIQHVNSGFTQITGYSATEAVGKALHDLLEVDGHRALKEILTHPSQHTESQNASTWQGLDKQGKLVFFRLTIYQAIPEKRKDQFVITLENISKESQYLSVLETAQEMTRVGGWEWEIDSDEMVWTDEIYRIYGLPLDYPVSLEVAMRYFFKESSTRAQEILGNARDQGVPGSGEFEMINEEGKFFHVHANCRPIYVNGKVAKVIGAFRDITREKRTLETLTQSEELYRNLAENFPSGFILMINRGFDILFSEGQGLRDISQSKSHLQGKSIHYLFGKSLNKMVEEKIWDAFDGESSQLDVSFQNKSYSLELRPLYNAQQKIDKVLLVCMDITERQEWEKQLRISESRYRELFESNPNPILVVETHTGKVLEANLTAISHYGFSQSEWQTMHWADLQAVSSDFDSNILAGVSTEKHHSKAGALIYAEVQASQIYYLGGEATLKIINDVTESLMATQALHSSHKALEEFHHALDAASMVVTLTLRGDFLTANKNFCEAYGLDEDALVLKNIRDFPDMIPGSESFAQIDRAVRKGKIWKGEIDIHRADGSPLFLDVTLIPRYMNTDGRNSILVILQDVTEKKLTEKQLVEYAQRSTNILESITDAMFLLNKNWEVTYINKQGESLLRISRDELLHKVIWDVFPKEQIQSFYEYYHTAIEENRVVDFEEYFEPSETWFEVHVYPSSEGLSVYFRSINERKAAEERILSSENSLKEAQRIARMGNWEYRVGANEVIWSDELFRLFKLDPVIDSPSLDLILNRIHRSDKPKVFRALRTALDEGKGFDLDLRIIRKDGTRYLNFICRPEHGPDDSLEKLYGILIDITERKEAEKKLIDSENRLREAQQLGKMGSWEYSPEEDTLLFSDEINTLLGLTQEQRNVISIADNFDVIHPDDQEALLFALGDAVDQGTPFDLDFRVMLPQGPVRYFNTVGEPLMNSRGNLVKLYGTLMDITERKQAETELKESNDQLKKTNQELDRFVYSASHDLRAPMVSVLGLINLAKVENDVDKLREYMGLMERSVRKLDNFVQEIIHYSRNSRLEVKGEPINFKEMIEGVIEDLQFMEEAKVVRRELFLDINEPFYTDRGRLNVVINNMISNAFRYSSPHRRDPYLNIYATVQDGKAILKFEDNGQGIAEEHQAGIFRMFYRASENSKGSGLGLYIVQESIEKLQGKVFLTSVLGQGTTFTIELPSLPPNNAE